MNVALQHCWAHKTRHLTEKGPSFYVMLCYAIMLCLISLWWKKNRSVTCLNKCQATSAYLYICFYALRGSQLTYSSTAKLAKNKESAAKNVLLCIKQQRKSSDEDIIEWSFLNSSLIWVTYTDRLVYRCLAPHDIDGCFVWMFHARRQLKWIRWIVTTLSNIWIETCYIDQLLGAASNAPKSTYLL